MDFSQIFSVSLNSLNNNKLRASLTILGVVVGIFSIIVIMTIITMLQNSIENGVSQLSKNTFQIQKFPAMMGGGPGSRAKFRNRKDITMEDFYKLEETLKGVKYIGAEQWQFGKVIKYKNLSTNPNIQIIGETTGGIQTNDWHVEFGRSINEQDVQYSANVCLIGNDVIEKLFPGIDPIGQTIKVDNYPLMVIGILEQQAQMFGSSRDSRVVLPISTFQNIYGRRSRSVNIMVMSESKENYDDVIESATGHMRTIRKVKPGEENDFDIFSNESMISQINVMTGGIKIGALVVSIIALLAAGVGIMNIMLVSVTERTKEIGIRKAVGAKRSNILTQFLIEAIVLCLIGGFVGILLGVGIGNLAGSFLNAQSAIPYDWVAIGLSLCVLVGIIFGTYPAYKASNLDPIEALRYE
ncbi:MAG: peptide ABC transporter permease [Ignavibacteriales bacterium CG_4_9_14_3_um_filter_30_11]|nr:MAG: peptide ABC transporter permease [Ignavibacteriales bacterium CG_4_9_14_3_um_filter_30_11]